MAEGAIKHIRVRNSDGTYGDLMPIGVNAINVDIADGSSLSDVLGPVNYAMYGSIQEQLSKLTVRIDNLEKLLKDKGIS